MVFAALASRNIRVSFNRRLLSIPRRVPQESPTRKMRGKNFHLVYIFLPGKSMYPYLRVSLDACDIFSYAENVLSFQRQSDPIVLKRMACRKKTTPQ